MAPPFAYKAFISYSHAVDGELGRSLQRALERFAKPWYRRRKIRVFRDQTTLAVTPHLWKDIERALGQSEYLILLASPEAANSPWVCKETEFWLEHRDPQSLLIVLTDGELSWNDALGRFGPEHAESLPRNLASAFSEEPLYVDLRWLRDRTQLSNLEARFRDAVATVAATLHAVPKDELVGEDILQHRRTVRLAWSAGAALAALTVLATIASVNAIQQRDLARERERAAQARELSLQSLLLMNDESAQLERSALLALESLRRRWTSDGQRSLRQALALMPKVLHRSSDSLSVFSDLVFDSSGTRVAIAHEFGAAIWELATGRVLMVHEPVKVRDIAFAPEGTALATAGDDGSVRIWDSATGTPLAVHEHAAPVITVAYSHDGAWLATGTKDGILRIFDLAADEVALQWESGVEEIREVAFSTSDRYVGAVSTNGPVRVFVRESDWTALPLEPAPVGIGLALAFSPIETHFAATRDNRVAIWSLENGRHLGDLQHSDFPGDFKAAGGVLIDAVAFSPDGKTLATAGRDGSTRLWDIGTREELARWVNSTPVWNIRFTPDGRFVATQGAFETRLWELPHGREVARVTSATVSSGLDVGADGRLFVSGEGDAIAIWQPDPADRFATMPHPDDVERVACSPDGQRIATIDDRYDVRVWNRDGPPRAGEIRLSGASTARFSPDGRQLVVNGRTGLHRVAVDDPMTATLISRYHREVAFTGEIAAVVPESGSDVHLWNLRSGERQPGPPIDGVTGDVSLSTNARYLATNHSTQRGDARDYDVVRVWDLTERQPRWEVQLEGGVYSTAISADGDHLAVDGGRHVTLYSRQTPDEPRVLEHDDEVRGLMFDETGRRLLTLAASSVHVWNLNAPAVPRVLAHNSEVRGLDVSDDGSYLATAAGAAISVWDLTSGALISQWSPGRRIASVCFLDDANYVVTGDDHDDAIIWHWRPDALIARACERLSRNLTVAEWNRYLGDVPYELTCPNLPGPVTAANGR